jgi:hypothetical protein
LYRVFAVKIDWRHHAVGATSTVAFLAVLFAVYTADNGFKLGAVIVVLGAAVIFVPCAFLLNEWLAGHGWGPFKKLRRKRP